MRGTLLACLCLVAAAGCGSYAEKPFGGPKPATPAVTANTASTQGNSAPPPGGGPVERQRLDQMGVKRVPLTNVVGVYLNAKASINSRLIAMNAHTVAEQFKGELGRYPNDYAELEVRLKAEGKALPELQPGHRYVFDTTDGQVYVESNG